MGEPAQILKKEIKIMKRKLILIATVTVCLAILLSSCSLFDKDPTLGSILNTEWVAPDDANKVLGAGEKLSLGDGYFAKSDDRYAVFVKTNEETNLDTIEIYNLKSSINAPMLTFTDKSEATETATLTKETRHYVDINDKFISVLTVVYDYDTTISDNYYTASNSAYMLYADFDTATYVPSNVRLGSVNTANDLGATYTLNIYTGNSTTPVDTVPSELLEEWDYYAKNNSSNYFDDKHSTHIGDLKGESIGYDLLLKGTKLYRVDEDGNETYIRDMGLSTVPTNIIGETEKYYVAGTTSGSSVSRVYVYYDKDLNYVSQVNIPNYGYSSVTAYVMNNGNLLYQTIKPLPEDAKKYDVIVSGDSPTKCLLDTFMVDIENGETKELDLDFVIHSVNNTYTEDTEYDFWSEDVENIAIVSRIDDDKLVDYNAASRDWVSINNKGKDKGSVKFMSELVSLPTPYENGYFASRDASGTMVIFDKEGNVTNRISQSGATNEYNYVVKDDIIYDMLGNKVFDKKESNVDSFEILADGVFIAQKETTTEIRYHVYVDGQLKNSYTVQKDELLTERVAEFGICFGDNAYYVRTVKPDLTNPNTYDYYNLKGELIGSYSTRLYYEFSGEDFVVARTITALGESEFYKFSFN